MASLAFARRFWNESANAVARTELNHQQRSYAPRRRWLYYAGRVVLAALALLAIIGFISELYAAILRHPSTPMTDVERLLIWLAGTGVVLLHFALIFQTLVSGANSITREKQARTWELLVLTGMDARRIVRGKWLATVQFMWPRYLLLAVLRAGLVVWFSAANSRESIRYVAVYNPRIEAVPPFPLETALAAVLVAALTLANLPFTAACGVMASARSQRPVSALIRALANRVSLILLLTLLLLIINVVGFWGGIWFYSGVAVGVGTLWDNGASLGSALARWHVQGPDAIWLQDTTETGSVVAGGLIAVLLYAGLTWYALRTAQNHAVREQALPPLKPRR